MSDDFVRYIVKCVQTHRDGNTDPSFVKIDEVLDITENQWLRLIQSAPFSFELIEKRVPRPEPLDITEAVEKQVPPEEEIVIVTAQDGSMITKPKRKPRKPKKAVAHDGEA